MTSGEPVKSQDVRPVIVDTGRPGSEHIIRRIGARFEIYRHPDTKVDKYFEEYEVVDCNDVIIINLFYIGQFNACHYFSLLIN